MRLLLDTHTLLWFLTGNEQLSKTAVHAIEDTENRCYVSLISLWEIAIKMSKGSLSAHDIGYDSIEQLVEAVDDNGLSWITLRKAPIVHVTSLPFLHKDPFDRLLIAQAISEGFVLVSKDAAFQPYTGLRLLW